MRRGITRYVVVLAALMAFGAGGAALTSASPKGTSPPPPAVQVQQGVSTSTDATAEAPESSAESQPAAVDSDNVQQGDQTAGDQATSEQSGSESSVSDGPGGYADSSPNADTQQIGEY